MFNKRLMKLFNNLPGSIWIHSDINYDNMDNSFCSISYSSSPGSEEQELCSFQIWQVKPLLDSIYKKDIGIDDTLASMVGFFNIIEDIEFSDDYITVHFNNGLHCLVAHKDRLGVDGVPVKSKAEVVKYIIKLGSYSS